MGCVCVCVCVDRLEVRRELLSHFVLSYSTQSLCFMTNGSVNTANPNRGSWESSGLIRTSGIAERGEQTQPVITGIKTPNQSTTRLHLHFDVFKAFNPQTEQKV